MGVPRRYGSFGARSMFLAAVAGKFVNGQQGDNAQVSSSLVLKRAVLPQISTIS
jgi:hypothetical protein